MRWLEFFLNSAIEIWMLIALLGWIVFIAIDKIKKINAVKSGMPAFAVKVRTQLKKGNIQSALDFCREDKSAIANIIRRGLKKYKFGKTRFKAEIRTSSEFEVNKLEERLSTLATISNAAPSIGFLGTILSLASLFKMIQNPQSTATFGDFSYAIRYALISAGMGILIGVISLVLYNYILTKINKVVVDMERVAADIFDLVDVPEDELSDDELVEDKSENENQSET